MCRAIRHDLIYWFFFVVYFCGLWLFNWRIIMVIVFFWFNFLSDSLFVLWGVDKYFFGSRFCLSYLVYQGSLNFIIYFYFPILKELMIYVSYCFISINNKSLVVKCYSSLEVSGFSRNEFNSCILFNFCCLFINFYFMLRLGGISSLFYFYN